MTRGIPLNSSEAFTALRNRVTALEGQIGTPIDLSGILTAIDNLETENLSQSDLIDNLQNQINNISAGNSSSILLTEITANSYLANFNNRLLLNPSTTQVITLPNTNLVPGNLIRLARFPGNTQSINLALQGNRYNTLLPTDGNARLLIPSNFTIFDLIWLDNTIGWLASQPNIVVARSNAVNILTYTALALESYTYFDSIYTITAINDANINAGVMKSSGGTLGTIKMRATFSAPVFLNEIRVRVGQFNGTFNAPDRMRVFRGNDDTGLLLFTDNDICIPPNNGGAALQTKTIDLLNQSSFDIPSSTFTFVFDVVPSGNAVSIADLSLRGAIA